LYSLELTGSVSSPTASWFGRVWSGTLPKGDEDTDNDRDEGEHKGPAGNGEEFEFDDDVDFLADSPRSNPFLSRNRKTSSFSHSISTQQLQYGAANMDWYFARF